MEFSEVEYDEHKYCTSCKTTKELKDFNRNIRKEDGYATQCKLCVNARIKINQNKLVKIKNGYVKKLKISNMIKKFKVSKEIAIDLCERILNKICESCGKSYDKQRLLHVEHSEINGEIKIHGIACFNCNIVIGHAKDIDTMYKIIEFMKKRV